MRAPVPIIPLFITCIGILLSVRLLSNVIARFMDYWMPHADRRFVRIIVKFYTIIAVGSVIFIAVGAILYKLQIT
jgi:hypothetical protein